MSRKEDSEIIKNEINSAKEALQITEIVAKQLYNLMEIELTDTMDNDIRNNIVSISLIIEIYVDAWRSHPNTGTYKQLRNFRRALLDIKSWKCGFKYSERVMEVLVNKQINYSSCNHLLRKITNVECPPHHLELKKKFRSEFHDLFANLHETIIHPKSNETLDMIYVYLCCCGYSCFSCCSSFKNQTHEKFINMYETDKVRFDCDEESENETTSLLNTSHSNYRTS